MDNRRMRTTYENYCQLRLLTNDLAREEVMKGLGQRIREARSAKGLSLQQLEDASGISKSYIWRIEKSEERDETVRPSGDTLAKLANALGISAEALLTHHKGGLAVHHATLGRDVPTLPPSLVDYIALCKARGTPLDREKIQMLEGIKYEGSVPATAEDWEFIMQAIRRSTS